MPQRDYAVRSKKKGGVNKTKLLTTVIAILGVAGAALWLLKENAPAPTIPEQVKPLPQKPNSTNLPSKPEEVYSYIRDLETREVITEPNKNAQDKLAQLSQEQLKLAEAKRKEEEARLQAIQQIEVGNAPTTQPTAEELTAIKAQELKQAEEKRKAEEARKAEQQKAEQKKAEQLAKAEKEKAKAGQIAKEQQAKKETIKATTVTATAANTVTAKPANKPATNQGGRFGLQCGAYKNKAQAENMQARLAMAGFNARIVSGNEWNRVFVGPVGDRAAASRAQSNARSVAECVIVSM